MSAADGTTRQLISLSPKSLILIDQKAAMHPPHAAGALQPLSIPCHAPVYCPKQDPPLAHSLQLPISSKPVCLLNLLRGEGPKPALAT